MNFDIPYLSEILASVIVAIIAAIVYAGGNYLLEKAQGIKNVTVRQNVERVINTITRGINYTNQTFVDELKAEGRWDEAAMKEAFQKTRNLVEKQVDADARETIDKFYSDFNSFIESEIENQIAKSKEYTQPIGPIVTIPGEELEDFIGAEDAQEYRGFEEDNSFELQENHLLEENLSEEPPVGPSKTDSCKE